jgi:GGDEF domain-containing protein
MAFALWLLEPVLVQMLGLAIALPAALVLAACALRALRAARLRGWGRPGRPGVWLDSRTGLMAEPALGKFGEPLLQRCQRRDEPLAVLVLDFDDLADVQDLYGIQARREMLGLIGRGLRRLAGRKGLALRVTQSRFLVLLPGCTGAGALARAAAKLGVPCSFELDSDNDELVLVPQITALCATEETDSIEQMLRNAQPQPVRRPAADSACPSAPMPTPMPVAPPAAKPKFDLPDTPRLATYHAYPATFPMPLSSAAGRSRR